MTNFVCLLLLGLFGEFAGMFVGAGNRCGFLGAIVCGALVGLLLNLPFLPDGGWDNISNLVLFFCTIMGAVMVNYVSENNWLKRRFLDQKGLRIDLGKYYRIGRKD
jgi:hypothetical protein